MAKTLEPVAPEERIRALDMLRGWAMFGVLWSNLNDHYRVADEATTLDRALSWTQVWMVESRFYSLLILLFGIGFGIQLTRAGDRAIDLRGTYYRRTVVLLAIGIVHGTLIWPGDILTIYALVAFALVLFLRPLAAAGQMALTTYLTQSIVCTLLFYGYGLGWYGSVAYTGMLLITLILFSGQMVASLWWLSRFRYGPAEWLWRTLTYGRAPQMREPDLRAAAAV